MNKFSSLALFGLVAALLSSKAKAVDDIFWIDWTSCTTDKKTCYGTLTTNTKSITVTYNKPAGIAFSQVDGTGTDFFTDRSQWPARVRDVNTSPFTSATVPNIPPAGEMIGLENQGAQTLTFSEPVRNIYFVYISQNIQYYAFDHDFDILSYGHGDDGNACGYWGCGTSYKEIVGTEYRLRGTVEPHGTLVFPDSFSSLGWSNSNFGKSFQLYQTLGACFFFSSLFFSPLSCFLQNIGMVLPSELKLRRKSIKTA